MPVPQGLFEFSGVEGLLSGVFTLGHGISPSVGVLEIAPQSVPIPFSGTLTLTYDQVRIQFPGCRMTQPAIRMDSGVTLTLRVEDRRWRWRFCEPISGRYNLRTSAGELDRSTEKTPQELARLLLERMGETDFQLADLPNQARPVCDWDYANPARELAALCEELGCRVVLGCDNRVSLRRVGEGRDLPLEAPQLTAGYGLREAARPDALLLVCGRTRVQSRFRMEAVGRDRDGEIRPIEELSYKPSGGWSRVYPELLNQINSEEDRRLALATVYRWYRIASSVQRGDDSAVQDPAFEFPGVGTASERDQVLPVEPRLLETAGVTETGEPRPARVFGEFTKISAIPTLQTTQLMQDWEGGFSLDGERGIVRLMQPAVRWQAEGTVLPARLFLECVHPLRDEATRQPRRATFRREMPGTALGTGPALFYDDDLAETIQLQYAEDGLTPTDTPLRNSEQLRRDAEMLLNLQLAALRPAESLEISYGGLIAIEPDGAIQQVQWTVGPGGAETRASRNSEFDRDVPSHAELRERERLAGMLAENVRRSRGRSPGVAMPEGGVT